MTIIMHRLVTRSLEVIGYLTAIQIAERLLATGRHTQLVLSLCVYVCVFNVKFIELTQQDCCFSPKAKSGKGDFILPY